MKYETTETSDTMPKQVSLRLPDGIWERAERVAEYVATLPDFEGYPVSTSRTLINAISRGLDVLEEQHGLAKKKSKK
jgi:hypothetical protein